MKIIKVYVNSCYECMKADIRWDMLDKKIVKRAWCNELERDVPPDEIHPDCTLEDAEVKG